MEGCRRRCSRPMRHFFFRNNDLDQLGAEWSQVPKMVFFGLKNDQELADVTAYLKRFARDGGLASP